MSLLSTMVSRRGGEMRSSSSVGEWFTGGSRASSGEAVTPATAMQERAMLAGVRYISETIASLPLILYRRLDVGKARAVDLPLYERLHNQPNAWQTSFEWRDMMVTHLILRGNAYSRLVPSQQFRPFAIVPMDPDAVEPVWIDRANGVRAYRVRTSAATITLNASEVLHFSFMPGDGLMGVPLLLHARETIGRSLALQRYGSRFFANNARPGGVLRTPKGLSAEARRRLREQWEERFTGANNAHRVAVLEDGMEFQPIGIAPDDAQWLGAMELSVEDIAGILRVPPHKIGSLRRSTFSNVEQQAIEAVVDSIRPWTVRLEQAMWRDLLGPGEKRDLFVEFQIDGLLRGDTASRYQAYATGRQWGWLSANDVRSLENQNPVEGGDLYMVPLNMVPATAVGEQAQAQQVRALQAPVTEVVELRAKQDPTGKAYIFRRLREAWHGRFRQAMADVLATEIGAVREKADQLIGQRALSDFEAWLDGFYGAWNRDVFASLVSLYMAYGDEVARAAALLVPGMEAPDGAEIETFARTLTGAYSAIHAEESRSQILAALSRAEPRLAMAALNEVLDRWASDRADQTAGYQTVRAGNAIAKRAWQAGNVKQLVWTGSGSCPLCAGLVGQVVAIEGTFAQPGDSIEGDGAPLEVKQVRGQPPLHKGCECQVMPA